MKRKQCCCEKRRGSYPENMIVWKLSQNHIKRKANNDLKQLDPFWSEAEEVENYNIAQDEDKNNENQVKDDA